MEAAIWLSAILLLLALYRILMMTRQIQIYLHRMFPIGALFFQYYTVVLVVLVVITLFSLWHIFFNEMWKLNGLDPNVLYPQVRESLRERFRMNHTEMEMVMKTLEIPPALRSMSLYAPVAVILTWVCVSFHVFRIVSSIGDEHLLEWFPSYRMDLVMQVVFLPLIYGVLSLRCVVRAWTTMTVHWGFDESTLRATSWSDFTAANSDAYGANFAMANFAEMYGVFCFSRLCLDLLRDHFESKEVHDAFRNVTMQGVNSFVLVGFVKAFATVLNSYVHSYGGFSVEGHLVEFDRRYQIWDHALSALEIFTSLQALYNIQMLCSMVHLSDVNPGMKFLGTRLLVIAAQVQGFLILSFGPWAGSDLSIFQGQLLHSSLVCFECVGMSVIHLLSWPLEDFRQGYLPLTPSDKASIPTPPDPFPSKGKR